ncbi:MAG: flagellar basal body L-ring protein FlgH, partial [Campylobacterota bacterium]|nr:flagellar basal body L-ring protein FlgH [Campylobacterota bacterium]
MNLNIISIITVLFVFAGCTTNKQEISINKKPKYQVPKKPIIVNKKKGSLYSRRGASLFADKKDLQVGDIIQVYIEESLNNESSDSRKTAKNNNLSLGGGILSNSKNPAVSSGVMGVDFGVKSGTNFTGNASQSSEEEFTTTISAIIQETYQNGNYFIKGSKQMLINGQKQNIQISGVIRPYDISPENTVYSYQLANLKVLYEKDGV